MSETKDFTSLKPFTLNLSKEFRDKHQDLTYKKLKAVIIKRMYGNLDHIFKSSAKPMMAFIIENKPTNKRKDINDKGTHIHGIREVFSEDIDCKVRLALKTSVCSGKKEYKEPKYHNMLHTSKNIMNAELQVGCYILIKECILTMVFICPNLFLREYAMITTSFIKYTMILSKN